MALLKGYLLVLLGANVLMLVWGHGRLIDPAARNAAWRFGFDVPKHFTDNELNCGGFSHQWNKNGGKCGVCGDKYDDKSPEFVGSGAYAKGVITKTYKQGQEFTAKVDITSNHKGYFVFKIGELVTKPITEAKLSRHVYLADGSKRFDIPQGTQNQVFEVKLKLPADLVCSHCVLRWWYSAGNNWGCGSDGCGIGKGPQETFVNCADVRITK